MAEHELSLREITAQLPSGATTAHLPSADLWPRIAATHLERQRRRRVLRFAGVGLAAGLAGVLIGPAWFAKPAPALDWQARAQALEIQLSATAQPAANASDNLVVVDAELARLDAALQAAYDRGAPANELVPLWKQRSALLSALLAARQQQLALTRI